MPEEMDMIRLHTIRRYIKEVQHLGISGTAADQLRVRVNEQVKKILAEATTQAKAQRRSTIMPRDIEPAMARVIGKKTLNTQELLTEIKRLGPIEIGQLIKLIATHIEEQKAQKDS
jgi:histone H3/H4